MSIRHRPMRPKDVRECVEIVAADPITGPRYGKSIADLAPAWLRLLRSNGFSGSAVFEEVEEGAVRPRPRMLGVGLGVFVSDDFLRELKTPPFFWIGPELAKRVMRGNSPVLSEKQVSEANSRVGLNIVMWHVCLREEDVKRPEVGAELMASMFDNHRGYLLKELVGQADSSEHLEGMRNTGGHLFRPEVGDYGSFDGADLSEILLEPHVTGLTREIAQRELGSWIGYLFLYQPPRFGFSRSEQRLLLAALAGGTDEELGVELGVSLSTAKKLWRSIYRRVAARDPELIPDDSQAEGESSKRGRSKKQRLMAYLREHIQELRPFSRKILERDTAEARRLHKKKTTP
jgi:DNA-binding CsgD family transcriptional regulator